jgi:histone H1/5
MQKYAALPHLLGYVGVNSHSPKGIRMTPALTLTLSAQAMTAVSAVIGQQMRLADVVIDQTFSAQRALMTPYFATGVKTKAPTTKKKAAAPKAKAPVKAKAAAPKPKLVAQTKPVSAKPVAVTPIKAAPVAKAAPVEAAPVVVAKKAAPAPVVKTPAKVVAKVAKKTKAKAPKKAVASPAAKVTVAESKPAVKAKPAPRAKTISVPDAPWDGKKASAKAK